MRFLLFLTSLLFSYSLSGQVTISGESNFEITKQYNINDGLSHNVINRIREDSRGFLWLATWEGLNRFDGQEFKKYYHERNNPNSLPSDVVTDILEYQPGRLLIATTMGLGVLNTITNQFENDKIQFAPLKAGTETVVLKLEKGPEGNIWVNHSGELDVFDPDLKYLYRFTDLDWAKSIKGIEISLEDWVVDNQGRIWIPSLMDGINIINLKDKSILNYKNNPDSLKYLTYRSIASFLLDSDSVLWVSPWSSLGDGLMKYDIQTGKKLANLSFEDEIFDELLRTDYGTFLLTIWRYCYEYNPNTKVLKRVLVFGKQEDSEDALTFKPISTCRSNSDTYWFGTDDGLFKLNKRIPLKEIKLTDDHLWNYPQCLFSRTGLIYIGGNTNLLAVFDREQRELKRYTIPKSRPFEPINPLLIAEDRSNYIWIGTEEGMLRFDPVTQIFDTPAFLPDHLKSGAIRVVYCDREGYVWIGTQEPFCLYSILPERKEIKTIPDSIYLPFTSKNNHAYLNKICEDTNGVLWMSSRFDGGLLSFDKKKNVWNSYPKSDRNKAIISNTGIQDIWPDASGHIWLIRSILGGIIRYDYRNDSISFISREDGLITSDILYFAGDDHGNLWLSSPLGISRYETSSQQVLGHFTVEYTPNYNEFNIDIDPLTKKLVLEGNYRYIFLDQEKMMDTFPSPHPILDGVMVNNDVVQLDPSKPYLNLNHSQKNISIGFTAINFSNTEKLQFAYTLSGEDDEWTRTTTNRNVNYTMLSPGKYKFKVKVDDGSGQWTDSYDLLSFTIRPPFWKQLWFIFLVGLFVTLITIAFIRRRIATIRHEADLKQKIAETEMMALRAQMNPHFIFNCINSIDALIQSNNKYQATIYLNKFAKLIRNILDSSKLNDMTIAKDLETLKLYIELEQFRSENKFTAEIIADPVLLQRDYKIPPLIIQPYVENAIIHGLRNRPDNEGKLTVTLRKADGYLQYSVEDNGVGRKNTYKETQDEKKSYGMEMSSERIRLFNEEEHASVTITDLEADGIPTGTRVVVLLRIV